MASEEEIWDKVVRALQNREIPMRIIRAYHGAWIEIRLSALGYALWPQADHDDLKGRNRLLARILRKHEATIKKSNGIRWAFIPLEALEAIPIDERLVKRKMRAAAKEEPEVLVSEVWPWP